MPVVTHTRISTDPDSLFTLASRSEEEEQIWSAIEQLRSIATETVFTHALRLCQSSNPRERRVGADVIAQFDPSNPTYHETVLQTLFRMLETEQTPNVLESIAVALGHRKDARAVGYLVPFQHHPDPHVRYGVVFGLLGHTDPQAVTALLSLSTDPDTQIRDWATFGLAVQIDTDTPAVREALVARLHDSEGDTAGEAMVGLARRKDERVLTPLLKLLHSGEAGSLAFEAAIALASPTLLPVLEYLREHWEGKQDYQYELLIDAITACIDGANG